jgi:hypothetical protein
LPPSGTEFRNEWSDGSAPTYAFMACTGTALLLFYVGVKIRHGFREKYKLMVLENRLQRKIVGSKEEDVTGDCTVHSFSI